MGTYLLKHLARSSEPLGVTVFERSASPGIGMPYDPAFNADYMLCNAFSREIPVIERTLIDWLKERPARELSEWELSPHDVTSRAFYPRVLIGEYLQSQFGELCERARKSGHRVNVRTSTQVTDIVLTDGEKPTVRYTGNGEEKTAQFDTVVIASGHRWPKAPEIDGVTLVSPWPYTNITNIQRDRIGVLGSSLSAIDIVVALGHARGRFEDAGDTVTWFPNEPDDATQITMVSHLGIMPEGDFYYAFPYEPLAKLTPEAIEHEIAGGGNGLLHRVFALLCEELDAADADYLGGLPPSARTLEGFAPAYFAHRRNLGGLRAVKRDLAETRDTLRRKDTIAHRYVLLRAHEAFDLILRELCEADYDQFLEHLMPVFSDCYAAVPHLSLARVIALYDAGVLDLVATEEGAKFQTVEKTRAKVATEDGELEFDAVIDARGQSPAPISSLPFPSLQAAMSDGAEPIVSPFELKFGQSPVGRVFCLALPQILVRHPFSQGLVECHTHSAEAAKAICE